MLKLRKYIINLQIMSITFNEQWQEVEKSIEKPQVLSLNENNQILMTLTWEDGEQKVLTLKEFLDLTDIEKAEIERFYEQLWFTLVAQRVIGQDYPEYFKDFHESNPSLFVDGKEMFLQRDQFKEDTSDVIFPEREKRELIFMKLNLPEKISPTTQAEVTGFKQVVTQILANMWLTK